MLPQRGHQEGVGRLVPRIAQTAPFHQAARAHRQRNAPGRLGQRCRQLYILGKAHLSGRICAMMWSAASSTLMSTVFTLISGCSGGS